RYGVPVVSEAERPVEVGQDDEYENEVETACLLCRKSRTITVAQIIYRKRREARRRGDIGNGASPVPERRFRHDIGIDRCPIKGVGHQLPKVLRQESYVADRFGLPVRRLKDLIEVRKRRIPKRVPKGEHMI